MALALELYEATLCPDCGQRKDRSHHPDMDGWFDVEQDECFGCAAVEAATKDRAVSRSTKLYVVEDPHAPAVLHDVTND